MARIGLAIDESSRITITDPILLEMEKAFQPVAGGVETNRDNCNNAPNSACRNEHSSCATATNDACTNFRPCMQRLEDVIV